MVPGRAAPRSLQPPVPEQLYRAPSRRGPAAPPGLFPAHPLGPGAAGTGGNCGFGVNSVPLRAAGARREGNTAPGQQRVAGARGRCPPGSTESPTPNGTGDGAAGGDSLPRSPIWAPSGLTDTLGAFPDKIHEGFPSAHGVIFAWGRVLQRQPLEVSGAAPHAKPQEEKASPADTSSCPMPHPLQHLVKPQIRALGGQKAAASTGQVLSGGKGDRRSWRREPSGSSFPLLLLSDSST